MAMANAESPSADAYIGNYISLISKSEIRYQGILYDLDPLGSTVTLQNVKSFGTEDRKKEGPQVLPGDKVYDYIFFRGSEIKDLHVISSPPVQNTPALPNDPAIIQSHYPPLASEPSSFSSLSPAPATNSNSFAQYGLLNSPLHGNLGYNQSRGILGPWGSLPPHPTTNHNGIVMPAYWPGHSGSSEGVSYLQEQSLLQTPRDLVPPPPMQQQQINSSTMSASIAGDAMNFPVFSHPMLSTVSSSSPPPMQQQQTNSSIMSACIAGDAMNFPIFSHPMLSTDSSGSPSVISTMPPTSTPPFSMPLVQYDTIPPQLSSNPITSASCVLPTLPVVSNSPFIDKPKSLLDPTLPCQSILPPVPSFVRSSITEHSDTSRPSPSCTGHISQLGPVGHSLSQIHIAQKDIEVVQESTPTSLSSNSECDMHPTESVRFIPKKLNGTSRPRHHSTKHQAQRRGNRYGAVVPTHQEVRDYHRGSENWPNGVAFDNRHTYRGRGRGRENRLNKGFVSTDRGDRGRARGRNPKTGTAAPYIYHNDRGHGQGRRNQVPSAITKFTEDFDFEAMYEKFNKKEIWGHLGKSNKAGIEDNESIAEEEDEFDFKTFDSNRVYDKDNFFDSLSCNLPSHESERGSSKISEQKKLDLETFGETLRYRRGYRSFGSGSGGRSRGSHGGKGRGRMVWVRMI